MHGRLKPVFNEPIDRREFLRQLGLFFLAIIGISAVLKFFLHQDGSGNTVLGGYGSSSYGGNTEGTSS